MREKPKVGDHVEWETSQGTTHGTVEKKLTRRTKIEETEIAATKDEPRYLVKSAKTGKLAAHTPEALKKRS